MGDNLQLESSRQVKVRDWLTVTRNTVSEPRGHSSLPKDGVLDENASKATGIKRPRSDSSPSPAHNKFTSNGCTSEHLVYVRRKLETEHGKPNSCSNAPNDGSIKPKSLNLFGKQQSNDQEKKQLPGFSTISTFQPTSGASIVTSVGPLVPYSSGKPLTGFPIVEPNNPENIGSPPLVNHQEASNLHWKDRFLQVQAYLKACDQSNQEEYIQTLRTLSPVERSNHAVALEKRAIHLILEEGKELHLMRVLNVFGNDSPVNQTAGSVDKPSTQHVAEESKNRSA